MLAKTISKILPSFITTLPHQTFSTYNQEQRFQTIRKHTTLSEYPNLNSIVKEHSKNKVSVVEDKETGLRFLIESGGFEGTADMGVCINLGTQNETKSNAGSLEYLKNFVHMKPSFEELVGNYQILSQTSSTFDLNYDVMTTYAKCSFLEEDQDLMTDLLLDLAFQEKNMFEDNYQTSVDNNNICELVRRTAFNNHGIGMPSKGVGNVLTNSEFLKFQEKITPKNTIISMTNINNPNELINKILNKIKQKYPKFLQRREQQTPESVYQGGLGCFVNENDMFEFAVAFPSVSSKSPHIELFGILRVLLGSASSFSSGGPGKGMHSRCTKYLLNEVASVEKASYINEHFENFGLFGLTVGGPEEQWEELVASCLNEIGKLVYEIPAEELERAKHILISSIYQNTERRSDRLEELTKHVLIEIKEIIFYDRVKLEEFEERIRKVTAKQIQELMKDILSRKPTFVYSVINRDIKLPSEKDLIQELKARMSKPILKYEQ